jgi:hypothetical protein
MFYTVDEIVSILSGEINSKYLTVNNVAEQCFYVLRQIGDSVIGQHVKDERMLVSNGILRLPEKVLKFEDVRWNGNSTKYNFDPLSLTLSFPFTAGTVFVDYWAVRTGEDGLPLIPEIAKEACIAYMRHKASLAKVISGTAREKRDSLPTIQYFDTIWREEVQRARGSINLDAMTKGKVRSLKESQKKIYKEE